MTAERYGRIYAWFGAHPAARRVVTALDRWLPAVPFVCYPVLLAVLGARFFGLLGGGVRASDLARAVLVPGLTFVGGSLLRKKLNRPRPYEQPGFVPLVRKSTKGKSFPSRHALSASVLAVTWLYFYPAVGWAMTALTLLIGVLRVLTGVHHGRDVAAGAALGFACGLLGMWGV